jgi:hypothetical protein
MNTGARLDIKVEDISHLGFTYDDSLDKVYPTMSQGFMPDAIIKMYPFEWLVNEIGQDELIA